MRVIVYTVIIVLSSLCVAGSGSAAASVYVWTDKEGRIHITDQPPAKGAKLRDVIEYKPQPAEPLLPSETEKAESQDKEALCRNVFMTRRNLRKTKSVALAVRQRAEEAHLKVRDLRERIGFDDDEMDDFKDDLKQLEEKAMLAEMFAQQAELDVQVAELQVKLAESEADADCDEGY